MVMSVAVTPTSVDGAGVPLPHGEGNDPKVLDADPPAVVVVVPLPVSLPLRLDPQPTATSATSAQSAAPRSHFLPMQYSLFSDAVACVPPPNDSICNVRLP